MQRQIQIRITILFFLSLLLLLPTHEASAQTGDFGGYRPHYQGSAAYTPGGRGGIVKKVTNLNDSGGGSLRDAVAPRPGCANTSATCAQIVVFETSGRIQLTSAIHISSPYLTIAGQTAPAPGITLSRHPLYVENTHDVVVQHIRVRLGDVYYSPYPNVSNTIYSTGPSTDLVVLDHVSASWHTSTGISIVNTNRTLIVDCLISEGLQLDATHMGPGLLLYPWFNGQATLARTVFSEISHRQPWVGPGYEFTGYNNLAYNTENDGGNNDSYFGFANFIAAGYPTSGNEAGWAWQIAWISNIAIAGNRTNAGTRPIKIHLTAVQFAGGGYKLHMSDNVGPFTTAGNQWGGVYFREAGTQASLEVTSANLATAFPWHAAFNYDIMASAAVEAFVLANAGARPAERRLALGLRDEGDYRAIQGIVNRNGVRIVSQNDVGGYPAVPVNTRSYAIPTNPNGPGACGTTKDGVTRTVIECDLEAKARALEPGAKADAPKISTTTAPRNLRIVRR